MRLLRSIALMLAVSGTSALAATPPDALFSGSAFPRLARGSSTWCAMDPGDSFFRRAGNSAKISVPDINYVSHPSQPQTSYLLTGQAVLAFSSATGGALTFALTGGAPANVSRPAFSNYTQSYDAGTRVLTVSLRILFPDCTLPVIFQYRG